jgi:hypothetical protein
MFSQDRTDNKPAKTDTIPESLHVAVVGRPKRWRIGRLLGERVANGPAIWRMEPIRRRSVRSASATLNADPDRLDQPVRHSGDGDVDEHAAVPTPSRRCDTVRP